MPLVCSTSTDGRVVLFERHEAHPNGEAFVASQDPTEVGNTPLVKLRIAQGYLKIVEQLDEDEETNETDGEDSDAPPVTETKPAAQASAPRPAAATAAAPTSRPNGSSPNGSRH